MMPLQAHQSDKYPFTTGSRIPRSRSCRSQALVVKASSSALHLFSSNTYTAWLHYDREIGLKSLTFRGLTSSRRGEIISTDADQQENILRPKGMSVLFYARFENKFAHLPQNRDM